MVKLLKNVKPHKAAEHDDIYLMLLKEAADEIAPAITLLFQASLNQGNTPSTWRKALVVPIYKKGSKSDASNYRPIYLTSARCKLCERILHLAILTHLANHKILCDAQQSYIKRRSCDTQLLLALNDFARGLEDKSQTDIIFLVIAKAFDKVSHQELLKSLLLWYSSTYQECHVSLIFIFKSSGKVVQEYIGRLARTSVLDTEVDGTNPSSSMLFP